MSALRLTAALALAEIAVHEARSVLAPVAGAHTHGAHLAVVGPALALGSAALLAHALIAASVAVQRRRDVRGGGAVRLWLMATAGLLALFFGQELAESMLSHHHAVPRLSEGTWVAIPASGVAAVLLVVARHLVGLASVARRPASQLIARLRLVVLASPSRVVGFVGARRPRRSFAVRPPGRAPPHPPAPSSALWSTRLAPSMT